MREGNVREKVHRRYLLMPVVNVRKTEMMWKMTGIASYCFICRGGMNREKRLTLKKAMLLNESSQTAKTPSTKGKRKIQVRLLLQISSFSLNLRKLLEKMNIRHYITAKLKIEIER